METFFSIMMYSGFVLGGLTTVAVVFVLLAKFLDSITHDPDAGH